MNKKIQCPNNSCNFFGIQKIIYYNNGQDNLDNLGHYTLECLQCGWNFNVWENIEKARKVFKDRWEIYN